MPAGSQEFVTAAWDRADAELVEAARHSLSLSGRLTLRVSGASMAPSLWPDDLLRLRACAHSEISRGEIVVFARDGRLIAHRLVSCGGGALVTRGDAARGDDPPLESDELLGVVEWVLRERRCFRPPAAQSIASRALSSLIGRSSRMARGAIGARLLLVRMRPQGVAP